MHTYDSCKHMLLDHSDLAPRPCGRRKVAILLMLAFMHHPYLVCTYTFGMPSLHLLKFLTFFFILFSCILRSNNYFTCGFNRKLTISQNHEALSKKPSSVTRNVKNCPLPFFPTSVTLICVPPGNLCPWTHFPIDICSLKQTHRIVYSICGS